MNLSDSQKWLLLTFTGVVGWLLYQLAPILMPFALATALAYLGDPLVDRLETLRYRRFYLNRTQAVIVVFVGIFLTIATILIIVYAAHYA